MSSAGILARGKANYEANAFLDNPETMAYVATLKKEEPKQEPKKKVTINFKEVKEEKEDASK